ncbi:MAG: hypothetical protein PWQ37_496 [Candidatus Petromonas sp.]|jgi:hypothetical protein|nr:hypothetical protein [Candidatus Petromonas sp.]
MREKTTLVILIIGFIFTLINPLIFPDIINTQDELNSLKFGIPIHFIKQQSSKSIPKDMFPYCAALENPWETPIQLLTGSKVQIKKFGNSHRIICFLMIEYQCII